MLRVVDPLLLGLAAVAALVLLGLTGLVQYNRMTNLRNLCAESWSDVDTELRRRHDLVPNLVATVKGYAAHEAAIFAQVAQARRQALAARDPAGASRTESGLVAALGPLLALAEAYPRLRAAEAFLALQRELVNTEDRIQAARRFYNANVRDYRNQTRQFPGVLLARRLGFGDVAFFEVSPLGRAAPTVRVA
jgi:LemA protein